MPIAVLDRELSGEPCLGGSSASANGNARADCCWLRPIAHAFAEPEAMAVAQLAAQTELEITAQIHFEHGYGMDRRLRRGRPRRCHPWPRRAHR